jgi:hypothetical protein
MLAGAAAGRKLARDVIGRYEGLMKTEEEVERKKGRDPLLVEVPTVLIRILKQIEDRHERSDEPPVSGPPAVQHTP